MALKYIADGFQNDADLLLNEFALEESSEFQIFASIWRKKNFSFIYMGRETAKELGEFTHEVFCLSSKFLESDSYWHQIGGVYLLYALYRNQILNPVLIRIELGKLEVLKHLLDKAIADKLHSLHYVLDYLFKNTFKFVASSTLLGPGVRTFDKSKSEFGKKILMSDFKCNLEELMKNKVLENLHESFLKYEKLKPNPGKSTNSRRKNLISILDKLAAEQKNISTGNGVYFPIPSANNSKNVRCNYPFIDLNINQIDDLDDIGGNDLMNEYDDESGPSESSKLVNKRQLLECQETGEPILKLKKRRRRVEKTRRIRKYYDGSPTKDITVSMPNIEALIETNSEDELLAD